MFEEHFIRGRENLRNWADLLAKNNENIVFFGAGEFCKRLIKIIRPIAIIDNDPDKWGTSLNGIPISGITDCLKNYIGIISVSSHKINYDNMYCTAIKCGIKKVIPGIALIILKKETYFSFTQPDIYYNNLIYIQQVYEALDEKSKPYYFREIAMKLSLDFLNINHPVLPTYFIPEIKLLYEEEVLIDGGAYDGDTIRSYPGKLGHGIAYEPDPENALILKSRHPEVTVINAGLGAEISIMKFKSGRNTNSAISISGNIEVRVRPLDRSEITFLKMDIEGHETEALSGAMPMLQKSPDAVLAISIYHKSADMWKIPLMLMKEFPDNVCMCRSHGYFGFDFVFYSVPKNRVIISESAVELQKD